MDPHWRPQHLNVMHGLIHYDFVGRLERFDADLAQLREMASLPDVPYQIRNAASTRSDRGLEIRPDLLRRVREVYARDLELYEY